MDWASIFFDETDKVKDNLRFIKMNNILQLVVELDRFYLNSQEFLEPPEILDDIPEYEEEMRTQWWAAFDQRQNNIKRIQDVQHFMTENHMAKPMIRRVSKMLYEIEMKMI